MRRQFISRGYSMKRLRNFLSLYLEYQQTRATSRRAAQKIVTYVFGVKAGLASFDSFFFRLLLPVPPLFRCFSQDRCNPLPRFDLLGSFQLFPSGSGSRGFGANSTVECRNARTRDRCSELGNEARRQLAPICIRYHAAQYSSAVSVVSRAKTLEDLPRGIGVESNDRVGVARNCKGSVASVILVPIRSGPLRRRGLLQYFSLVSFEERAQACVYTRVYVGYKFRKRGARIGAR